LAAATGDGLATAATGDGLATAAAGDGLGLAGGTASIAVGVTAWGEPTAVGGLVTLAVGVGALAAPPQATIRRLATADSNKR